MMREMDVDMGSLVAIEVVGNVIEADGDSTAKNIDGSFIATKAGLVEVAGKEIESGTEIRWMQSTSQLRQGLIDFATMCKVS